MKNPAGVEFWKVCSRNSPNYQQFSDRYPGKVRNKAHFQATTLQDGG